jgi:lipopolysaccharide export system protein LptA
VSADPIVPNPCAVAVQTCARSRLIAAVCAIAMVLTGFAAAPTAFAERADRFKPTQVEADRMDYDDLKQVNVFTGSVVLTRGTMIIKGDRMVVTQDAAGYQYGTTTGRLASFRQKRDGVDEWVEGYGEEIEYDGKTEVVKLRRTAKVRRLEGTRVMDEIDGPLIIYDSRTERFNVEGGQASGPVASGNSRVKVVIQPRLTDPGDATPPAAPTPGTGGSRRPASR